MDRSRKVLLTNNKKQVNTAMEKYKAKFKGNYISVEDLAKAELEIIKLCQREKFSEEILSLSKGQEVKQRSHVYKLNPMFQD